MFAKNIFLSATNFPGYEIQNCKKPIFIDDLYNCIFFPNPFTPNSDGMNDYVQFDFMSLSFLPANIYIYDVHSVLVRQISVPAGADAKRSARWDGLDNNGKPLPQGLYIYVIEVDGEIVCKGTVTIAR